MEIQIMKNKLTVRVAKVAIVEMNQEDYDNLIDACYGQGDRQMLNELVDFDSGEENVELEFKVLNPEDYVNKD